ncbi:hypothetical protein RhiirC2_816302 [Rhizophagus irregularis]|uniref:Uncharacterized protein n=1 Tax=Rhizophagus irregularis TaxID=588596 RepID=A0A2N1MJ22_9GLOM|nr:hypothetical protein RhiirC2_816302 [Rhizophagus irregularis]
MEIENGGCEENGAAKNDENTNQNYGMQNKTKKENMLKQNNIEQDTEMEYLEDEELCMRGINISNHRPKGAKVKSNYNDGHLLIIFCAKFYEKIFQVNFRTNSGQNECPEMSVFSEQFPDMVPGIFWTFSGQLFRQIFRTISGQFPDTYFL